jgi:hypothetical protein
MKMNTYKINFKANEMGSTDITTIKAQNVLQAAYGFIYAQKDRKVEDIISIELI